MKTIHQYIFFLLFSLLFASCNNDGDIVTLADVQQGELKVSATSIVLLKATSANEMLSISWNIKALSISDTAKYGLALSARTNTLQFDTTQNFTQPKELVQTDTLKSFIGSELNAFALSMGLTPGTATHVYARLKSTIGANMEPKYSNVVSISVTPYDVISYLYMPGDPSGGWNKYTAKLCSPASNGAYEGYVQAAQWANFKFTNEPDGTGIFYGSLPNSLYTLDASSTQWNIWFDVAGYFLIKANTNTMTWNKTAITAFSISGDFNSWSTTANPMTYNATTKVWTATCNFQPGEWGNTLKIIANNDWVITYGSNNGNGILKAGEKITITSAGTHTVTMDLSNPLKYTYTIQ
ncbi:MAG TPA: DUF5111 domain-containing protein [Paludibacter sp.]